MTAQQILQKATMSFYCQHLTGDVNFSIDEWNKVHDQIQGMGLSEKEEKFILFGPQECCKEQCFDCMAIVGERRLKTNYQTFKKQP